MLENNLKYYFVASFNALAQMADFWELLIVELNDKFTYQSQSDRL